MHNGSEHRPRSGTTLVVRFSSLGDVVLTGAVTGALAPVTFCTLPRYREVAAALPGVEQVVGWGEDPMPKRVARVVDLHASLRSWRAGLGIRAPTSRVRRHDLRRRLRVAFKTRPAPPVVERYARAAGVEAAPLPWIPVEGPGDALILCPSARWATKRWPPERWVELGRRWDGPILVLGGPSEAALCQAIARAVGGEPLTERGFARTLDTLGRGRVAVAGDTGLLHLCAAAGIPSVGIFGPTTSADGFWMPEAGTAVESTLPCRPCSRFGSERCPVGDHLCLAGLETDRVWAAVTELAGRAAG